MEIDVKVDGTKKLLETFKKLPTNVQNKALRPALRKGGAVVRDAASANVKAVTSQEATGLLARSLRVYSLKRFRGSLRVGVMVKKGLVTSKGVRVGLYAGVLEYGKQNQPPRPWIRKAARESTSQAFNAITTEIKKRLDSAVEAAKK